MATTIMSNAIQYQFDLSELAEMLLKKQGIKEGLWSLGAQFSLAAANAGPDPSKVMPSMIVSLDKLRLSRTEDASAPLTFDAAKLNP
jgi:hypothetical protein